MVSVVGFNDAHQGVAVANYQAAGLDADDALGIALAEFAQHRRQDVLARGCARADAQAAVAPLGEGLEAQARRLHLAQDFFRVPQELLARLREQHAPADAIEQANATKIIATCSMYTAAMGQFGTASGEIDTLVLGCTHYAFAVDQLASLVGPKVNFLEGGTPVARQTHRLLAERGQLATAPDAQSAHGAQLNFYTTGSPSILQTAVQRWLSLTVEVRSIAID